MRGPGQHDTPATAHEPDLGKIEVAPGALATIASAVVAESYGVVGLTSRRRPGGLPRLLRHEQRREGVEIRVDDGRIVVDLYVILEYGTRLSEVAHNLMSNVTFALEHALGLPVEEVNVNVQGVRVSGGEDQ